MFHKQINFCKGLKCFQADSSQYAAICVFKRHMTHTQEPLPTIDSANVWACLCVILGKYVYSC